MPLEEDVEFVLRRLDEDEEEEVTTNDGETIRNTLMIYGSLYVIMLIIFCTVRRRFPRTFQVRNINPKYKCDLAGEQYGWWSWIYQLAIVNEDDILDQCGMDALCFLRIMSFGCKVSVVGVLNSFWLFPIYATAPGSEETDNVDEDDRLAKLSATNIPPSNARLIAPAIASWIVFGFTMKLILSEFEWFTRKRHLYLSRTVARNYTIYIKGIAHEYQSSAALLHYFQDCFGKDAVLEAHIALDIPNLEKKVAQRDKTLFNLEHAITLKRIKGEEPTHKSAMVGGEAVNSIDAYAEELRELNRQISDDIVLIKSQQDPEVIGKQEHQRLEEQQALMSAMTSVPSGVSVSSEVSEDDDKLNSSLISSIADESAYGRFLSEKNAPPEEAPPPPQDQTEGEFPIEADDEKPSSETKKGAVSSLRSKMSNVTNKGTAGLKNVTNMGTAGIKNITTMGTDGFKTIGNTAMALLATEEDGRARESGFVTFRKLTTTHAALQMIHHHKPFVMHTDEAPAPHDVTWRFVGKTHEQLQSGFLVSLGLTGALCLFWTIPVSFISSLTEVDALKENVGFIEDLLDEFPFLEEVFAQLAPLLIVVLNAILPHILKAISMLELPISKSILEASVFVKLAIFMVIQTFFVSAISGSLFQAIDTFIDDPWEAIDVIATALPQQAIYFVQILLVATSLGQTIELLNIPRVSVAKIRSWVGPNLTQKERDMKWMGLITLVEPWELMYGFILGKDVLYFMVTFVYSSMTPITNYFMALCYTLLNIGWRHQLVYIYPPVKDSGGKLWTNFIGVSITCMIIAQFVLLGWFGIKKAPVAAGIMVPLIIVTFIFNAYIRQEHFRVPEHLPTAECVEVDYKNMPMDYSFVEGQYMQAALRATEVVPDNAKDIFFRDAEESVEDSPDEENQELLNGEH